MQKCCIILYIISNSLLISGCRLISYMFLFIFYFRFIYDDVETLQNRDIMSSTISSLSAPAQVSVTDSLKSRGLHRSRLATHRLASMQCSAKSSAGRPVASGHAFYDFLSRDCLHLSLIFTLVAIFISFSFTLTFFSFSYIISYASRARVQAAVCWLIV